MAGIITAAAIAAVATVTVGVIQDQTQKKMNNAAINNMKEDQKLKLLSVTDRAALDYRVANAQDDVSKLALYEEALSTVGGQSNRAIGDIYAAGVASKSKQNYLQRSVLIAGGIMLVGGTLYQLRKK
jgi:predicted flavoprotein YhiN